MRYRISTNELIPMPNREANCYRRDQRNEPPHNQARNTELSRLPTLWYHLRHGSDHGITTASKRRHQNAPFWIYPDRPDSSDLAFSETDVSQLNDTEISRNIAEVTRRINLTRADSNKPLGLGLLRDERGWADAVSTSADSSTISGPRGERRNQTLNSPNAARKR